jgi:hypothetical protein
MHLDIIQTFERQGEVLQRDPFRYAGFLGLEYHQNGKTT